MASISSEVDNQLQALRDVGNSGHLGAALHQFVLITVDNVYAAPGNFSDEKEMLSYLKTLRYLIDLHVYKPA